MLLWTAVHRRLPYIFKKHNGIVAAPVVAKNAAAPLAYSSSLAYYSPLAYSAPLSYAADPAPLFI